MSWFRSVKNQCNVSPTNGNQGDSAWSYKELFFVLQSEVKGVENWSCFSWGSGWNRCCWSFLSQWIKVKEEYDILWTPQRKESFPYLIYLADLWNYIYLTLILDLLPEEPGTKTGNGKIHPTCLDVHWINLAIPPLKEFPAEAPGWQEPRKGWWSEGPGEMNSLPRVRNGSMRWLMKNSVNIHGKLAHILDLPHRTTPRMLPLHHLEDLLLTHFSKIRELP